MTTTWTADRAARAAAIGVAAPPTTATVRCPAHGPSARGADRHAEAARVRSLADVQPQDLLVQRHGSTVGAGARGEGLGLRGARSRVQSGISNFFGNLRFPVDLVNNLLQGKARRGRQRRSAASRSTRCSASAASSTPRATSGSGAQHGGLRPDARRLGRAAGSVPRAAGLGPSTCATRRRSAVDSATAITPFFVDAFILVGARVVDVVNTRAPFLDEVSEARRSLDYYAFVRNAYLQRRQAPIEDRAETPTSQRGLRPMTIPSSTPCRERRAWLAAACALLLLGVARRRARAERRRARSCRAPTDQVLAVLAEKDLSKEARREQVKAIVLREHRLRHPLQPRPGAQLEQLHAAAAAGVRAASSRTTCRSPTAGGSTTTTTRRSRSPATARRRTATGP